MFALTTMETSVFDVAHCVRITTSEHLVDEIIIVGRIVARTDAFKPILVLGKDLFEDVPTASGFCIHRSVPIWDIGVL